MTQKEIIKNFLRWSDDWVVVDKLVRVDTKWGYLSKRAERTAREMRADGIIERKIEGGRVYYRLPIGHSSVFNELQELKKKDRENKIKELKVEVNPTLSFLD